MFFELKNILIYKLGAFVVVVVVTVDVVRVVVVDVEEVVVVAVVLVDVVVVVEVELVLVDDVVLVVVDRTVSDAALVVFLLIDNRATVIIPRAIPARTPANTHK